MSDKLTRSQKRKQQTRERLLTATGALLQETGYNKLTVQAVTDHADLGYGTFYLHFTNLDDAVWAVMERIANATNAELVEKLADKPPRQRAYLSWVHMFQFVGQSGDLFLELFGKDGSAQLVQSYQTWLAHSHEQNMKAGNYAPHAGPSITFQAQYMGGATLRVICWWAENNFHHSPHSMAKMLYEMTYQEPLPFSPPIGTQEAVAARRTED